MSIMPTDAERRLALRRMKTLATVLFLTATVVFAVSFALQDRIAWLGFVRAAAEGAMVGALADWFAVTALFRRPLGLPIPHTAIIPTKKNEIGAALGAFVEHEFLSDEVVLGKLRSLGRAKATGTWLRDPRNAERLTAEGSVAGAALLELLSDSDVTVMLEQLARRHLFGPDWAPPIGRVGERLVAQGQQHAVVDALLERADSWLATHPEAFGSMVSDRLPSWMPRMVDRFVDERAHREVLGFVRAVRDDPRHPLRLAIDRWLDDFTQALQHDPVMIERVERIKFDLVNSPRVRELAGEVWSSVKTTLLEALDDPHSELRRGARQAVVEVGEKLATDRMLQGKVDRWVTDAAAHLVRTYRSSIAGVITETIERWDAAETTQKLELQVGRDLQFIRINGTVVGALAGLAIDLIATGLHAVL